MKRIIPIAAVVALLVIACLVQSRNTVPNTATASESRVGLVLAAETSLLPATVWVAEHHGYFDEVGLDLTIREFDSGRNALESMLKGSAIDVATVAQTPIVFNSTKSQDLAIIAAMARSTDDVKIVARSDRDIKNATDLVGKKIGVTMRSTGHYFLDGFLLHYGLSLRDIELVDLNAADLPTSLASGVVDAITTWEPHIHDTLKLMDRDDVTFLISPTAFRKEFYFATKKSNTTATNYALTRFLNALLKAENRIIRHPAECRDIIAKRLGADATLIAQIWDSFEFRIELGQGILHALEDEARWAAKSGYFSKNDIPNYLHFVDPRILKSIRPDAVSIIHRP